MSQVEQVEASTLAAPATSMSTYRMPRVNLLPPEIEESRKLRRTQGLLAGGLVCVVAALGAGYMLQVNNRQDAESDLAVVQAKTNGLKAEQTKYADVPRTIAAIDAAEAAREQALAQDVEWYRTLTNFSVSLPTNVWFTGLTLNLTGASATTAAPAGAATSPAAPGATASAATAGVGTLSVQGTAMDHPDVATWLDVLAKQPGLTDAYFSTSTKAKIGVKSVVNFESTATITDDALSHRYDRKQG